MKNEEAKDIALNKVVWTIKDFGTLKTNHEHCSEVFTVGRCAWKFALYRGSHHGKYLGLFVKVADVSSFPGGWSIYATCTFTVVNQVSTESSVKKSFNHKFVNEYGWGYFSYMELAQLESPSNGYILNNNLIVEVEISEVRFEGIQVLGQIIEKALLPKDDDFVEFKDLGEIEKSLVPHLDEVCSWHPSLLDCKKNKSRRFAEWAFTSLGRVLQFLKNKKWKDMYEKACEELQQLWEELEMSKLDLSWLEPLVNSALNMKGYVEKVEKVRKMKQKLAALESEINIIKEKLVNTEQSIEMMRKELVDAEEDFEEKDLEAEIGYGKP